MSRNRIGTEIVVAKAEKLLSGIQEKCCFPNRQQLALPKVGLNEHETVILLALRCHGRAEIQRETAREKVSIGVFKPRIEAFFRAIADLREQGPAPGLRRFDILGLQALHDIHNRQLPMEILASFNLAHDRPSRPGDDDPP